MLDLSFAKIAVLIGAAVLIFGPDKVPHLIRDTMGLIRRLQALARAGADDLKAGLGPEFADLSPRDLHPRALLTKALDEAFPEGDTVRDDMRDAFESARDLTRSPCDPKGEVHIDAKPSADTEADVRNPQHAA